MTGGDSMDAIILDEWELLPDLGSSFFMEECTAGGDEEEAMEAPVQSASAQQQHAVESKDIGVVLPSKATEVMVSDAEEEEEEMVSDAQEEEEEMVRPPAAEKEVCDEDEVMVEAAPGHPPHEVEEGAQRDRAGMDAAGFSVGKLRVNGVGALCSFGVAAATFCILVLGGRPQQQQRKVQDHKSQFQVFADDERIHRAVEQASRLNQAVSSVMGGASTRATVSFGGHYNGF
ncbi:hypothetical protein ACQJBY_046450 [Aegilops geniculata]